MRPGCCSMVGITTQRRCDKPASYEVKGDSNQWHPWCTEHLEQNDFGKHENWKIRRWRPGRGMKPSQSPADYARRIYEAARAVDPWPGGGYSVGFDSSGKAREVMPVNEPAVQGGHAITFPIRQSWKENHVHIRIEQEMATRVIRPSDIANIKDVY